MTTPQQAFFASYSQLQKCMSAPACSKQQKAYEAHVRKTAQQHGPAVDARMECMLQHCAPALNELTKHWKAAVAADIKKTTQEIKETKESPEYIQYLKDNLARLKKKHAVLAKVKGNVTMEQAKKLLLEI